MAIILRVFLKDFYLLGEIEFSFQKLIIMIFCLLILLIGFLCQQLYAQDPIENDMLRAYDQQTIYLYSDLWGEGFVKNGQIMALGRFGRNLEREVANSPSAFIEIRKARNHKKIAIITGASASILGITDIVLQLSDTKYSRKRSVSIPIIVSSAILGSISKLYDQSYRGSINRAIWLYNRSVIQGN